MPPSAPWTGVFVFKIGKAASGNFKLCTETTYIALKRPKPCLDFRRRIHARFVWSGLVYYRGRATPLRVRSWRGAFTTSPHGPEFAAGSGFECRSHGATNLGFLPHSTLVGLTHCSCSRSLALVCLSVRARGWGRRGAVRRAVLPTLPSAGCRRPTPPPRRCCCRCCHRRCCRCRW